MKTKNIYFLSLFAYPLFNKNCPTTFGGSEIQLYQIAQKLSKIHTYKINFIVGNFNQKLIEFYHRIKVIRCGQQIVKSNILIKGIFPFGLILILLKTKPDVLIQRAAGIETGLLALYRLLFKKKFIYMAASSIDTNGNYRKMNPLKGVFYEFGLKHASAIISQNQDQQSNLKKYFHLKSEIIKNSFAIPTQIPTGKKGVLWVGSSQSLKQPQIFLNLAKTFPKQQFTIIIPKHNLNLWNNIFHKSQKILNLKFIEKVPFEKINVYFTQAKLFINTSTYEGFPNTFVQATMNGTPIISLNVNPDKFLDKYNCGYCVNGSLKKLTQYTKKLLTGKKLWSKISHNAYQYAQKNHDIEKNIKKLIHIINR